MFKARFFVLVGIILAAAASRLIPHPPNFAPITAMALFGGAYFSDRRFAFLVPLTAMLLSDFVIGLHSMVPVVYGSFGMVVCIGLWLRRRRTLLPIASMTLASSILFFVVTNFGVWAIGSLYPKNVEGLIACYVSAIPFFQNTLIGDLVYTATLFGSFALAERWIPALSESTVVLTK